MSPAPCRKREPTPNTFRIRELSWWKWRSRRCPGLARFRLCLGLDHRVSVRVSASPPASPASPNESRIPPPDGNPAQPPGAAPWPRSAPQAAGADLSWRARSRAGCVCRGYALAPPHASGLSSRLRLPEVLPGLRGQLVASAVTVASTALVGTGSFVSRSVSVARTRHPPQAGVVPVSVSTNFGARQNLPLHTTRAIE